MIAKDEDTGEEIWEVVNYPDPEHNTGIPEVLLIPKSQVTPEMIQKGIAKPHMKWEG